MAEEAEPVDVGSADASRAAALVDPDAAWRALYDLDDDTEDEPEASDEEPVVVVDLADVRLAELQLGLEQLGGAGVHLWSEDEDDATSVSSWSTASSAAELVGGARGLGEARVDYRAEPARVLARHGEARPAAGEIDAMVRVLGREREMMAAAHGGAAPCPRWRAPPPVARGRGALRPPPRRAPAAPAGVHRAGGAGRRRGRGPRRRRRRARRDAGRGCRRACPSRFSFASSSSRARCARRATTAARRRARRSSLSTRVLRAFGFRRPKPPASASPPPPPRSPPYAESGGWCSCSSDYTDSDDDDDGGGGGGRARAADDAAPAASDDEGARPRARARGRTRATRARRGAGRG